ncbi:sulfurtransferase FdhD [Candidatus Uabimicrobium amorphum]|uniref:Sulfur carrier protein FdhD n=2 Tax=Uabimicrobium amorphum TaxID=2596890 RepID=A0A5S9IQE9_UABAM|nr:sulfurtransferase FdhD [Candidatus Uabimicrobium amorphum]
MSVHSVEIVKYNKDNVQKKLDVVAVEEPLEIRLEYGNREEREWESIAVTMRTPGDDFELALGFLFSEGIIQKFSQVHSIYHCQKNTQRNIVYVKLKQNVKVNIHQRNFYMTSSCGVCGKAAIEHLVTESTFLAQTKTSPLQMHSSLICGLPGKLYAAQQNFKHTGGLHAAGLFDCKALLLDIKEDVGRHNAFDKLYGASLIKCNLPLSECVVVASGRASFELIQKSAMAGIPVFVAVGAPSSLAVRLANESGITLIGFTRENRFNVYSHADRIVDLL